MLYYENKTHTLPQVRSNFIDRWNNNKASIIDSLVLSAYEIQSQVIKGRMAFLEDLSRKLNETHQ